MARLGQMDFHQYPLKDTGPETLYIFFRLAAMYDSKIIPPIVHFTDKGLISESGI